MLTRAGNRNAAVALGALLFTAYLLAAYARTYFFLFDDTGILSAALPLSATELFASGRIGFYRPAGFLLQKLQYAAFGWNRPQGFAATSILLHAASVVALFALVRRLDLGASGALSGTKQRRDAGRSELAAVVAAGLFLASPWASEALFWMACQFDLLAVLAFLLAMLFLLEALSRRSAPLYVLSVSLYGVALFSKEFAITLLLVVAVVLLRATRGRFLRSVALIVPFATLAAVYLIARARVMADGGSFAGAYGNLAGLYSSADALQNVGSYAKTLLLLHEKSFPALAPAAWIYTAVAVALTALAALRVRAAWVLGGLFITTALPVLWAGTSHHVTTSGRLLYAPAILWCLAVGLGAEVALAWSRRVAPAALATCVGIAVLSTASQARSWSFATGLARRTVEYVLRKADGARAVHVTNLPFETSEGPFVLKTYNLTHHLEATGSGRTVQFSADAVKVSVHDAAVQQRLGLDGPRAAEAMPLDLPLRALRP